MAAITTTSCNTFQYCSNKMIHLVCIPQILLSALQITNHYSFEIQTPLCTINFAIVFILLLSLVYVQVDFQSGVLPALILGCGLPLLCYPHAPSQQSLPQAQRRRPHPPPLPSLGCPRGLLGPLVHWPWHLRKYLSPHAQERAPALLDNLL